MNWRPDRMELRAFFRLLLLFAGVLSVLVLAALRLLDAPWAMLPTAQLLLLCLLGIAVLGFLIPEPMRWFYLLWCAFGATVGIVVTNVTFILFYYFFFSVIAVVMRLTGRDPLRLKRPLGDSMWIAHKPPPNPGRYYRQF